MAQDNPFAEPGDDDRTVIRPAPGGRAPVEQRQAAAHGLWLPQGVFSTTSSSVAQST
ncbi:hypothetical protein [Elioraea sp. Yellowstone]|uniref:hypothetical protein n=1 Tax=Elioraea sp. Yellowstone TaxID=2592070 RepID=UPI001F35A997|nr:hypothetical protein [Elioraea sp. Yellowstone]